MLTSVVFLESLNLPMQLLQCVLVLLAQEGHVLFQLEHFLVHVYLRSPLRPSCPDSHHRHLRRTPRGQLVPRERLDALNPAEGGSRPPRQLRAVVICGLTRTRCHDADSCLVAQYIIVYIYMYNIYINIILCVSLLWEHVRSSVYHNIIGAR